MAIQQFAYDIPNDIAVGILKGVYKRFGGVVRDGKTGVIVKHLKEVDIPKKSGNIALQVVRNHPVVAIGMGVAVTVGGAGAYIIKKREKIDKRSVPICVIKFEKSLKEYLKAVRKGRLNEKTIDRLMFDLEGIKETKQGEDISIVLSTRELKELVDMIYDYTKKLAKVNDVKLNRLKQTSLNSLNNLHSYLEVQKKIFEEVA